MSRSTERLLEIVRSVEPEDGFCGYFSIVDALEADVVALEVFKRALLELSPEELDSIAESEDGHGLLVLLAADTLDFLPDDPRSFRSPDELAELDGDEAFKTLISACILNDVRAVEVLAKRVDVNRTNKDGSCPLDMAIGNNHPKCVSILLEYGADPNHRIGESRQTLVHRCAGRPKEILLMLIEAGGSLETMDTSGRTPVDEIKELGLRAGPLNQLMSSDELDCLLRSASGDSRAD